MLAKKIVALLIRPSRRQLGEMIETQSRMINAMQDNRRSLGDRQQKVVDELNAQIDGLNVERQKTLREIASVKSERDDLRVAWEVTQDQRDRWIEKCDKLESIIDNPGQLIKNEDGSFEHKHWAASVLLQSLEDTLADATNGVIIRFGYPGTARDYEVTISRVQGKCTTEVIQDHGQVIDGLLSVINHLASNDKDIVHHPDDLLFKMIFRTDDRIAIKRALQILEDMKKCNASSQASVNSHETAGSTSSYSVTDSASTSSTTPIGYSLAEPAIKPASGS